MKKMDQRNAAEEETYVSSDHDWLVQANHTGWGPIMLVPPNHKFRGSTILLFPKTKGRNVNILETSSMMIRGRDVYLGHVNKVD